MRLLILAFLCAVILSVTSCPPDDEQTEKISKPLKEKFEKDICGQGIKPGGQADLDFLNKIILPYYLSKKWLNKDPPKGWEAETDKIIKKCHKNSYNYCDQAHREKVRDCVKGMAGSLMLRYGSTAMAYCPILDDKVEHWEISGDKEQAFKFISQYCESKGKKC